MDRRGEEEDDDRGVESVHRVPLVAITAAPATDDRLDPEVAIVEQARVGDERAAKAPAAASPRSNSTQAWTTIAPASTTTS